MPPLYAYEQRYWYDHMGPLDAAIWDRFVRKLPLAYDDVQYDVPVGQTPDFAKEPVVSGGASMERVYKRKIDVVGYILDRRDVIEVKPKCTMSTIGQVLGYKHLLMQEVPFDGITQCVIVTEQVDTDAQDFAQVQGVAVIMV